MLSVRGGGRIECREKESAHVVCCSGRSGPHLRDLPRGQVARLEGSVCDVIHNVKLKLELLNEQ